MVARRILAVISVCFLLACTAWADHSELEAAFADLFPKLGEEQAQQRWQELCWNAAAPGREADRTTACTLMAAKLGPETPAPARIWMLKQLERIGRGESVEATAAALGDPDPLVRDAAVRALANNPDARASDRLRAVMFKAADPLLRVAVLNSLGYRRDTASLSGLIMGPGGLSSDPAVQSASARALGKIATPEALALLRVLHERAKGPARVQTGDALARCAEVLRKEGKLAEARSIAELLYRPGEPARLAGLEGLLRTAGDRAPDTILQTLSRADANDAAVAIGYVASLDTPAIKRLSEGLASLPAPAQTALVTALGARRDRAALPAVTAAAGRDNAEVKTAALTALGGVGDASAVPLLLKAIQDGDDSGTAKAARHGLETVFVEGVDEALINELESATDKGQRRLLIEILDHRRASAAVPALLKAVSSDDGEVRLGAIAALGHVAGAEDIPVMVQATLKMKDGGDRNESAGAVALVCGRLADEAKRAEPVLAVFKNATPGDQLTLLPLLGRIGGQDALLVVRDAVASRDASRRLAGQEALLNWPDSAVAEDVAKLAETTTNNDMKVRAIQVLARVAVQPGTLSDDAKLDLLKRGFKQAARDEEKRLLLDRARETHTFAAVQFAADHMHDPNVASQAIATVVDLLHREEIRAPNQPEADKILDRVIALSKDKSLIERAKSFKKSR